MAMYNTIVSPERQARMDARYNRASRKLSLVEERNAKRKALAKSLGLNPRTSQFDIDRHVEGMGGIAGAEAGIASKEGERAGRIKNAYDAGYDSQVAGPAKRPVQSGQSPAAPSAPQDPAAEFSAPLRRPGMAQQTTPQPQGFINGQPVAPPTLQPGERMVNGMVLRRDEEIDPMTGKKRKKQVASGGLINGMPAASVLPWSRS